VKPKDDVSWVAQGNFGLTGGDLRRTTFDVSLENGEIVIKFITGPKTLNPVRLVLKGDNRLEGMMESQKKGNAPLVNRPFKFEKVESKPKDDK